MSFSTRVATVSQTLAGLFDKATAKSKNKIYGAFRFLKLCHNLYNCAPAGVNSHSLGGKSNNLKRKQPDPREMGIFKDVEKRFPCRTEIVQALCEFFGDAEEPFPSAVYLFGHSGTGKSAIVNEFLRQSSCLENSKLRVASVNCVECYTSKILLQNILESLGAADGNDLLVQCDNLKDFVESLRHLHSSSGSAYVIALDNAERLRDMDANLLPSLLRLQQLCGLNVCVVLISQLPYEKYYNKTGLGEVLTIYCAQYTKVETLRILGADFSNTRRLLRHQLLTNKDDPRLEHKLKLLNNVTKDFFGNYLNLFLSVFYKACRDLPELKITARKCFALYMEPVLDGSIDVADVSRLWRYIANPLKTALSQVYLRLSGVSTVGEVAPSSDRTVHKVAQTLELPYYGKYLLIAAFLASYNSSKEDKRLFVKHHGKRRKRMQSVNAAAKMTEKMSTSLGPKSFTIDRLLAIFYAILEEKVGLTCNLLSQISTLVQLKLLTFVSGENNVMDGSSRLQCTVGLEFILCIGQVVGFNVRQYLSDFK